MRLSSGPLSPTIHNLAGTTQGFFPSQSPSMDMRNYLIFMMSCFDLQIKNLKEIFDRQQESIQKNTKSKAHLEREFQDMDYRLKSIAESIKGKVSFSITYALNLSDHENNSQQIFSELQRKYTQAIETVNSF